MLFPELNRHERDSMKASEAFFRDLHRRVLKVPKKKVFVIGFHKTGTSSLGKALQILGYKVCNSLKAANQIKAKNPEAYRAALMQKAKTNLKVYNAFQDTPWFLLYKELYAAFPNAYFILSKREENAWIRSVNKHFGNSFFAFHKEIYGSLDSINNPKLYLDRYREHNRKVCEFFEGNPRFLQFDLENFN